MRSEYFWRMRSASALRFSNGCSSLNLERIVMVFEQEFVTIVGFWVEEVQVVVAGVEVVRMVDVG